MKYTYLLFLFPLLLIFSCKERHQSNISFYYWKTSFELDGAASETLTDHQVGKLFVRYFDVDKQPGQLAAKPVAPIVLSEAIKNFNIVPVVFIKKRVFEETDSSRMVALAKNILSLVTQINQSKQVTNAEVQFDCDWTESTMDNYFFFLQTYHDIAKQRITATIRLHQVKYYHRTGVPPVDRGVLMYYNMGEIASGNNNSIYDAAVARKYNPSLARYPLALDVALPIFAWGQQLRDGQVIGLLNKINSSHFANDSNFTTLNANRLRVKRACFKAGYYFQANDEVKLESVSESELLDMAAAINKYLKNPPQTIIFYDLDSINLVRYDKDVYKKVLDCFN